MLERDLDKVENKHARKGQATQITITKPWAKNVNRPLTDGEIETATIRNKRYTYSLVIRELQGFVFYKMRYHFGKMHPPTDKNPKVLTRKWGSFHLHRW